MLSIVIPTYNEKGNIEILIKSLSKALDIDYEIIVVDDNSPDGTSSLVEKLSKKIPSLRLLRRERKSGLSSAVAEGVAIAKGEYILIMDADLSHQPEIVPLLASALKDCDIVVGSRFIKGGAVENWPLHRKAASKGAEILARLLLNLRCSDPLSGFFALRKEIFEKTKLRTKGYKLLLNILADNQTARIREVPYVFRDRHAGKTKLDAAEMINFVADVTRIRFR